jgi:uncharacterized protein YndB with AHSA1/START domain
MTDTPTRTVVIEKELPYPPAKIWRALTEGDLIRQWLMDSDFLPTVGHKFNFRSTPVPNWNGIIESEVLIVEPYFRLSYSWGTLGIGTIVLWTLTPTASGTLLRMEQSGFGPGQDANFKGAQYGWQRFITKMERVLTEFQ